LPVARSLEREWDEKFAALENFEREYTTRYTDAQMVEHLNAQGFRPDMGGSFTPASCNGYVTPIVS
jgi:hypothetical protein